MQRAEPCDVRYNASGHPDFALYAAGGYSIALMTPHRFPMRGVAVACLQYVRGTVAFGGPPYS